MASPGGCGRKDSGPQPSGSPPPPPGQAWPEKAVEEGRPSAESRASVPTLWHLILPEGSSPRELLESHTPPPPKVKLLYQRRGHGGRGDSGFQTGQQEQHRSQSDRQV